MEDGQNLFPEESAVGIVGSLASVDIDEDEELAEVVAEFDDEE